MLLPAPGAERIMYQVVGFVCGYGRHLGRHWRSVISEG